jgi:hypothetical protein
MLGCGNNSLFQYLFFSGCGKTLERLPAREEKRYVMEDVQQVGGAVCLSATKD